MSSSIKLKNANGKTISVTNSNANQTDKEVIYLNTVDELANASGSINAVAIVSDLDRGGTFEWSATGTANGGTVFTGSSGYWVRQYDGAVNVKWFGAKGDAISDDTNPFLNSVLFCRSNKLILDISGSKIYLESLSSPIDITDLEIIGNGIMCNDYEDYDYMAGDDNFTTHLDYYQNSENASAIIHNANMAVFTGKTFYVRGVGIYCNPTKPNSSGFIQTVKPVGEYGTWSRALKGDYKGTTVRFTGSYGIYLYGGLEVKTISNLNTNNNIKQGLYIDFTDEETKCPIEYLEFKDCRFTYSNEDCVHIEHAAKQIKFDHCCFNGSGRHFTGTGLTNILAASNYSHIKYGVRIKPKIGFNTLIIDNCYAEESQGMAYVEGGYVYNIKFTNNILYHINASYIRFALAITSSAIINMEVRGNYYNADRIRIYIETLNSESNNIYIGNSVDITNSIGITTAPKTVFTPNIATKYLDMSGTLGDGTAMTATYTIAKTIGVSGINVAAYSQVYLITASWQAQNSNSGGAYLLIVTRMPSGIYVGYTIATSSVAGFSSTPTIAADGTISIPLAQYYRGRVTRIDANQSQNMFIIANR